MRNRALDVLGSNSELPPVVDDRFVEVRLEAGDTALSGIEQHASLGGAVITFCVLAAINAGIVSVAKQRAKLALEMSVRRSEADAAIRAASAASEKRARELVDAIADMEGGVRSGVAGALLDSAAALLGASPDDGGLPDLGVVRLSCRVLDEAALLSGAEASVSLESQRRSSSILAAEVVDSGGDAAGDTPGLNSAQLVRESNAADGGVLQRTGTAGEESVASAADPAQAFQQRELQLLRSAVKDICPDSNSVAAAAQAAAAAAARPVLLRLLQADFDARAGVDAHLRPHSAAPLGLAVLSNMSPTLAALTAALAVDPGHDEGENSGGGSDIAGDREPEELGGDMQALLQRTAAELSSGRNPAQPASSSAFNGIVEELIAQSASSGGNGAAGMGGELAFLVPAEVRLASRAALQPATSGSDSGRANVRGSAGSAKSAGIAAPPVSSLSTSSAPQAIQLEDRCMDAGFPSNVAPSQLVQVAGSSSSSGSSSVAGQSSKDLNDVIGSGDINFEVAGDDVSDAAAAGVTEGDFPADTLVQLARDSFLEQISQLAASDKASSLQPGRRPASEQLQALEQLVQRVDASGDLLADALGKSRAGARSMSEPHAARKRAPSLLEQSLLGAGLIRSGDGSDLSVEEAAAPPLAVRAADLRQPALWQALQVSAAAHLLVGGSAFSSAFSTGVGATAGAIDAVDSKKAEATRIGMARGQAVLEVGANSAHKAATKSLLSQGKELVTDHFAAPTQGSPTFVKVLQATGGQLITLVSQVSAKRADKAEAAVQQFTLARDTGIAAERAMRTKVLGTHALCTSMAVMRAAARAVLRAAQAALALPGMSSDPGLHQSGGQPASSGPQSVPAFADGITRLLGMQDAGLTAQGKAKLARTVLTRLCAVMQPLHERMGAAFRPGGTCLHSQHMRDAQGLGHEFASASNAIARALEQQQHPGGGAGAPQRERRRAVVQSRSTPAGSSQLGQDSGNSKDSGNINAGKGDAVGSETGPLHELAWLPQRSNCGRRDIYDVIMTRASDVPAWARAGYEVVRMDVGSIKAANGKPGEMDLGPDADMQRLAQAEAKAAAKRKEQARSGRNADKFVVLTAAAVRRAAGEKPEDVHATLIGAERAHLEAHGKAAGGTFLSLPVFHGELNGQLLGYTHRVRKGIANFFRPSSAVITQHSVVSQSRAHPASSRVMMMLRCGRLPGGPDETPAMKASRALSPLLQRHLASLTDPITDLTLVGRPRALRQAFFAWRACEQPFRDRVLWHGSTSSSCNRRIRMLQRTDGLRRIKSWFSTVPPMPPDATEEEQRLVESGYAPLTTLPYGATQAALAGCAPFDGASIAAGIAKGSGSAGAAPGTPAARYATAGGLLAAYGGQRVIGFNRGKDAPWAQVGLYVYTLRGGAAPLTDITLAPFAMTMKPVADKAGVATGALTPVDRAKHPLVAHEKDFIKTLKVDTARIVKAAKAAQKAAGDSHIEPGDKRVKLGAAVADELISLRSTTCTRTSETLLLGAPPQCKIVDTLHMVHYATPPLSGPVGGKAEEKDAASKLERKISNEALAHAFEVQCDGGAGSGSGSGGVGGNAAVSKPLAENLLPQSQSRSSLGSASSIFPFPLGRDELWERVPVSPFEDLASSESSTSRITLPYLWLRRRLVVPDMQAEGARTAPACADECALEAAGAVHKRALGVALLAGGPSAGGATV